MLFHLHYQQQNMSNNLMTSSSSSQSLHHLQPIKKRRNLPGNPDPEAEVIALSPKTLLATNRFICEICKKGFQRDQNLQLHRRGHNLPWKLKQRTSKDFIRKKVYVCPEPTCVHHDPSRALGDLTGIKKHFCRKHGEKKWKCDKCSKRYAVQSDWKAHSKTCGTREYKCDCGTLFSRRDSFITHRAFCDALAGESARPIIRSSSSISKPHLLNTSYNNKDIIDSDVQTQLLKNEITTLTCSSSLPSSSTLIRQQGIIQIPSWLGGPHTTHHNHLASDESSNPKPTSLGSTTSTTSSLLPSPPNNNNNNNSSHIISATALLQKAAQMGSTISQTCSPIISAHHTNPTTHHVPAEGRHVTITTTNHGFFSSSSITSFEEALVMKGVSFGNECLTRDFLGLKPLSHDDIITMAGFGNCMSSSSSSSSSSSPTIINQFFSFNGKLH